VGALNAAHVASYPKGQEREMSDDLLSLWTSMEPTNFYRNWRYGGIIRGFLFKQGLYDTSPLHEFIKDYFESRTINRHLHINSVDAQTGDVVGFDETNTISELITGLCASTAVPFVFPPVKYKGHILMDGGVAWNLDIASAIIKCRNLVDSDDKIFLDVIDVDQALNQVHVWNKTGNSVQNYLRARSLRNYYERMDDQFSIQQAFPKVNYRYVIVPKVELDSIYQELSLDHALVMRLIEMGM
jgi:hypothetical protein